LAERTGTIGFAMFTRGHIHDHQPIVTIESHGALKFFDEALQRAHTDVAALFELWAVGKHGMYFVKFNGNYLTNLMFITKGEDKAETLVSMQKKAGEMIRHQLRE
jgi:hypothetical protein